MMQRARSTLVLLAALSHAFAQQPAVAVSTRADSTGAHSLLLEIRESRAPLIDEVHVDIHSASAALLPPGWKAAEKNAAHLTGPETRPPFRIRLAIASPQTRDQVRVTLLHRGHKSFDQRIPIEEAPSVEAVHSVQNLLILPPVVSPGEALEIEVSDPRRTPLEGRWKFAGVEVSGGPVLPLRLPDSLKPGGPFPITYTDPWGEALVDVPASGVWIAPPPVAIAPRPRITDCKSRARLGSVVCVCGYFPGSSSRSLLLDGAPVKPVASSLRTVFLPVRAGVAPGKHIISGQPAAGFPASDKKEVTVWSLRAVYDEEELRTRQTTTMHIEVIGSAEPLPVRLANHSPETVLLDPLNFHIALSSGGSPNQLDRHLRALRPGNFSIEYQIEDPPCPCVDEESGRRVLAVIPAGTVSEMTSVAEQLAATFGLSVVELYAFVSTGEALVTFQILDDSTVPDKVTALLNDLRVRLAQPDYIYRTAAQSSGTPQLIKSNQLPGSLTGRGVRLALIDTGVDLNHPALKGKIAETVDLIDKGFTPDIHATLLAGIIGGIAPGASLIAIKACQPYSPQDVEARCSSAALAKALDYATRRKIPILQLGATGPPDKLVEHMIQAAASRTLLVVAPAGNDGPDAPPAFPASMKTVVAVTAVDNRQQLYPQATRGDYIDLAAPGVDILGAAPGGGQLTASGTSLAAAYVSAVAALLLELRPGLGPVPLQRILEETATGLSPPGKDPRYGSGLVDPCKAAGQLGAAGACR